MDPRNTVFKSIDNKRFLVRITADAEGILSGTEKALEYAENLGISLKFFCQEGSPVKTGGAIAEFTADPFTVTEAEDLFIGALAKSSGIATAAKRAVDLAEGKARIVAGAWKKMPAGIKEQVRNASLSGGAYFRICEPPMFYLDKNYVVMLGGVDKAVDAAKSLGVPHIVAQVKGRLATVAAEIQMAINGGADIIMIDTGLEDDLQLCNSILTEQGLNGKITIAFAGNVKIDRVPELIKKGAGIIGIGKEIVDAPLLDMRLDVIEEIK